MTTTYNNLYFKYPLTLTYLQELGFKPLSSAEENYLTYRFGVEFWEKSDKTYTPTLFCTFTVNVETWEVKVDVRTLLNNFYPDFYSEEANKDNPLMERIHRRINSKLKELNIVRKKKPKDGSKIQIVEKEEGYVNDKRRSKRKTSSNRSTGSRA